MTSQEDFVADGEQATPRIAVAGFQHETNTFAPLKAALADFEQAHAWSGLTTGAALFDAVTGISCRRRDSSMRRGRSGTSWCRPDARLFDKTCRDDASLTPDWRGSMARALMLSLALALLPSLCGGGPAYETFRSGILGVPWGATLDDVVGLYPNGDHVFAVTPGHRAYWVKDRQPFLSVPRERNGVLYGFDENNRVAIVAVAFEFERKVELRNVLTSLLGPPRSAATSAQHAEYRWQPEAGMAVTVTEFGLPHQQIVWLVVHAPGYKGVTKE
jgi:hypothetical protein